MTHSTFGQQAATDEARRIVIAGGGTAGWMTAALLSRQLPEQQYSITVVDSESGGIGVGEATLPSLVRFIRQLGADEAEFMRDVQATWKLGIQFQDWKQPGHCNWHPFGVCGALIDDRDLFSYWLNDPSRPYHSFSLNYAAAVAGKSPHRRGSQIPEGGLNAYAFHLDAVRLADWLKRRALNQAVRHQKGTVAEVRTDSEGQVESLILNDGTSVPGDLFVDCTGFEAALIRKVRSDDSVDLSDRLLCDSAVTMQIPASAMVAPYTKATALSAGWMWDIPLMNRRGVGYVYSSQHVSDERAAKELRHAVGAPDDCEIAQTLKFSTKRQGSFWEQNVVAVGLSAGFVEPLESSGLHLVQTGVEKLIEHLPHGNEFCGVRDSYNEVMVSTFDQIVDFVQLHYTLSDREEPFWKAAQQAPLSAELKHRLKLFDEIGILDELRPEAFPAASYYYLLAGNDRLPKRPAAYALSVDLERLEFVLQAMCDQNQAALRQLPLHEETLRQVHRPPDAQAS